MAGEKCPCFLRWSGLLWLGLAWLATLPVWLSPGRLLLRPEATAAGLPFGDQAFFLHALWWVPRALLEGRSPWFSPYLGAPDGLSLYYSTLSPALGLVAAPLSLNGAAVLAYNLFALGGIGLTAWMTGWVALRAGAGRLGALVAGALLFYPPFLRAQLTHLNILSAWVLPLGYLVWLHWLDAPRSRWRAVGAALVLGLGFYVSFYHTLHLGFLLVLDGGLRLWWLGGAGLSTRARRVVPGFLVGVLVFCWALLQMGQAVFGYGFVLAPLGGGLWLWWRLRRRAPRWSQALLRRMALGAVCLGAILAPYFLTGALDARQSEAEVRTQLHAKTFFSAQLPHYFLSAQALEHLKHRGWFGGKGFWSLPLGPEHALFPGYGFWLLVAALLCWRALLWFREDGNGAGRDRGAPGLLFWLGVALFFGLLSMGPLLRWGAPLRPPGNPAGGIFLPALCFEQYPLLEGYRVFARMGLVVQIALAVAAGLCWRVLMDCLGHRGAPAWLGAVATGLVVAFFFLARSDWPHPVQRVVLPDFYEKLAEHPPRGLRLAEIPSNRGQYFLPLTRHRQALLNVYVSREDAALRRRSAENVFFYEVLTSDHDYPWLVAPPDSMTGERLRVDFARLGLDGVLLHPALLPRPGDAEYFHRLLGEWIGLERRIVGEGIWLYARKGSPLGR